MSCQHGESLWGRCVHCGMTWEQQARAFLDRIAEINDEHGMGTIPASPSTVAALVKLRAAVSRQP